MIIRTVAAVALAAATLGLTACTTTVPGTPAPAAAEPTWSQYADDPAVGEEGEIGIVETPAPVGPPTTARGAIPLALGEVGLITYQVDGSTVAEFAVHGMKRHKGCDNQFIKPPAGMRPLSVDVTINTHADPTGFTLPALMFGQSWEYIAPDGTSIEAGFGAGMSCEYNSPDLKPNRKYTETIWMLVPADAPTDGTGQLVWSPGPNVSFEWALTA